MAEYTDPDLFVFLDESAVDSAFEMSDRWSRIHRHRQIGRKMEISVFTKLCKLLYIHRGLPCILPPTLRCTSEIFLEADLVQSFENETANAWWPVSVQCVKHKVGISAGPSP